MPTHLTLESTVTDVAPPVPPDLSQNGKIEQKRSRRSAFTSISGIDYLRHGARGTSLEFIQLGSGTLHGLLARAELGLSSVHSGQFSLPLRAYGDVSTKELTFGLPDDASRGLFNGERLTPGKVLLYRPGAYFDGISTGAYHDWTATVEPAELERFVFDLSGREMKLPQASCTPLHGSSVPVEQLRSYIETVIGIAANIPAALDDDRVQKVLHGELMVRLAALVTDEQHASAPEPRSGGSRAAIVHKAEEFILGHLTDSICIADICAFADVSERSLRLAFHQVMGIGPNAYLKVRRLHCVRADLERVDSRFTSISMTALQWGFWHFGHFTHDYVKLFGEKPSDTLRHQRPHTS